MIDMILRMDPCPTCGTQLKDGKCNGCGYVKNAKKDFMKHEDGKCYIGVEHNYEGGCMFQEGETHNPDYSDYFRYCPVCGKKLDGD